ncbi:Bifunctional inhibitor/plant lipid transfer protein/seed storage helical domain [Dillenia turbinata]|uniref:Bifunctional inhibitor/plant lipid transfer protein/seed storage helical domain n=1 Tax=Dillenia turbinata TaxID=194707 RepID=A0AAN8URF3_9MAGN
MVSKIALACVCVLAIWAVGNVESASSPVQSPAPSADCSSLILSLSDCLSYVSNGSTATKPEKTCCAGLKSVLKANPECLCEGFKSSAQLGVVLNVTKALTLPSACHVSSPPLSDCRLSLTPTGSPAESPSIAVTPSGSASSVEAPAPSPGTKSAASMVSVSLGYAFLVCLLTAFFASF